jgi:hypothetical protein
MLEYEWKLESALQVYRSLDRDVRRALLHGKLPAYISLHELLALRDEAFRMIECNCVDHIITFHLLKKELKLKSTYDPR